ncbi:hypothetical protein NK214_06575 [Chromobacterium sp. S0633]|uniref:hypothetical protein n=1 Tax=Chromobacterium sp. S0633 TaxID=2957805 RepID=UPI0020A1F779|nr:hypothetical protein [Chromobacterium sp. S0633]MCP1289854.1 hypothetical protein [Chromobacterium sp. S0633]
MAVLTFPGYGAGAREVHIMSERITHWRLIDYNGRHGTCIQLDTGKEINVEAWPEDVKKAVAACATTSPN